MWVNQRKQSNRMNANYAAGVTDIGRHRTINEDRFLCDPARGLFIVCDGMGGMAAGEEASNQSIDYLDRCLHQKAIVQAITSGPEAVYHLLRNAIEGANSVLVRLGRDNPQWSGMGSTVVIALLAPDTCYIANLGDSRAYHIHNKTAEIITTDHSVAAALVASGQLEMASLRSHTMRNRLTGCLGREEFREPALAMVSIQPDDRVILCSDGLWDRLEDVEIARIASMAASPMACAHTMVQAANRAGGNDNITVILLQISFTVLTEVADRIQHLQALPVATAEVLPELLPDVPYEDAPYELDTITGLE
jgi:serine/threonine protein phosphatase PrpC